MTIWQDIKCGIRQLGKNPGFTAVAMFTMALGIGANLALFGILNEMLLRPKPVMRPNELWAIGPAGTGGQPVRENFCRPYYEAFRKNPGIFDGIIGYAGITAKLKTKDGLEEIDAELVSGDYFSFLGVKPVLGRGFRPEEESSTQGQYVAVISDAFWKSQFGSATNVLGETLTLNNTVVEIIGVAPKGFAGLDFQSPCLWLPASMEPMLGGAIYQFVGRLKDPKLATVATDCLTPVAADVKKQLETRSDPRWFVYGTSPDFHKIRLESFGRGLLGTSRLKSKVVRFLQLAAMATILLLLIACANVSGLFLARAMKRRNEIATRMALGASRLDLMRQVICEGILVAAGGTAGALLAFTWISRMMMTFVSWWPGRPLSLMPDVRIWCFALSAVLVSGLGFSVLPAWQASRFEPGLVLKDTQGISRKRAWLRHGLIVTQVVGSLILLCGAVLCLRSMGKQLSVDLGYPHERLALAPLNLEGIGFTTENLEPQLSEIVRRVSLIPDVEQVCVSPYQPLVSGIGVIDTFGFKPEGYEGSNADIGYYGNIGPGLFALMGIPILRGREYTPEDIDTGRQNIIVNERFAQTFWPGQEPLGKHFGQWVVIGVVKDASFHRHDDWLETGVFRVTKRDKMLHAALVIRT